MKQLFFILALWPLILFGQLNPDQPLPNDPNVRYGVLDNGLAYYIKFNNHIEKRAHFEIFHAVGALQEEDNQNGLAHFLEHLAFNGLGHFQGKSMLEYMETIGVKFGSNVNAATSTNYTRYLLKDVPTIRQGIIDTCLLVLYDWSGSILAEQSEIDAERGVIEEEWRSQGGLRLRVSETLMPYFYNFSKHAKRNVIGDMNVVRAFERKALMDFYHTWYRPDLQAIAIVGDFDIDQMERDVKARFSKLPKVKNGRTVEEYGVPDNKELLFVTFNDPEVTAATFEVIYKHPAHPKNDQKFGKTQVDNYYNSLIINMMNDRLNEIIENGEYPVRSIGYSYGTLAGNRDMFAISTQLRNGADNLEPGITMTLKETERIRRFGFTEPELERAKAAALMSEERAYAERDKRDNGRFINSYFNNFIYGHPFMDMETRRAFYKQAIQDFTLEEANRRVKTFFRPDNQVVDIVTPASEATSIPDKKTIEKKLQDMASLDVSPYVEKTLPSSLMSKEPVPGKIVEEKKIIFGATEWTLSNGAKVYLLPTENNKEELLMDAFAWGGTSSVSDEEYSSSRMIASALALSGVGKFSATELSKYLAGKFVHVTPTVSEFFQNIGCATNAAGLETMLQLVNLYFTEPRFDEEAFNRQLIKMKEDILARKNMPFSFLQDSVVLLRADNHLRAVNIITNSDDVDKVDFDMVKKLYARLFGNPQDYAFVFIGAIDFDQTRPLVEKYIGSLKGPGSANAWKDHGKRAPKGIRTSDFKRPMETPLSTVFIEYTKESEYTNKKAFTMTLLQQVLDIRYTKLIREDKGGVYSVDIESSMRRMPVGVLSTIVSFQTNPELLDELKPIVGEELNRLVKEGIDEADFQKGREYLLKQFEQNKKSNFYWSNAMRNYIQYGTDQTEGAEIIAGLTSEDLRLLLKELVEANNILTVIMRPE